MRKNIKDNDMLMNTSDFGSLIKKYFGFAPISVEVLDTDYSTKIKTDFPTKVLIKFNKPYALKKDDDLGKIAYNNFISEIKNKYGYKVKVNKNDIKEVMLTLDKDYYPKFENKGKIPETEYGREKSETKAIISETKNQLESNKTRKVELENRISILNDKIQKLRENLNIDEELSYLDELQKDGKDLEAIKNQKEKVNVLLNKLEMPKLKKRNLESELKNVKKNIEIATRDLNSYEDINKRKAELKYGGLLEETNEGEYRAATARINRILGDSKKSVKYAYKRMKMKDSAFRANASVEYTPKIKNYIKEYGKYSDYDIQGVIENAVNSLGNYNFGEATASANTVRINQHKNANKQYTKNVFGIYQNPLFPAEYDDKIVVAYDAKTNEIIVMNYDEFTSKTPREWGTEYEGTNASRSALEERREKANKEFDEIYALAFDKDRAKLRNSYFKKNKLTSNMRDLFEEADEYIDTRYKEKLGNLKELKNQYLNSEDEKEKVEIKKQYKDLQKQIRQDKELILNYYFPIIASEKGVTREEVERLNPQSEYWKGQKAEMLKKIARESDTDNYTKNRKEFFLKGLETVLTSPDKIEEFLINPGKSKAVLNNETIYNINDLDVDVASPSEEANRIAILNKIKVLADEAKINYTTILSNILARIVNLGMSSDQIAIPDALKSTLAELEKKTGKGTTARGMSKERIAEIDKMGEEYGYKAVSETPSEELKEANQYFGLTSEGKSQKQLWKGNQQPDYRFSERDSKKKAVDSLIAKVKTLKDDYYTVTSAGVNIRSFYNDENGRIYIVGDGKDGKLYVGWGYDLDHGICDGGMFLDDEATYTDALEVLKEKYGDMKFLKDEEAIKKAWKEYKK